MEHVDEKMSTSEVIEKLMGEIVSFLETKPQDSSHLEPVVEMLRGLTPDPHGDAQIIRAKEEPVDFAWNEMPMQSRGQYHSTSAPLDPVASLSFENAFREFHNPMGQQQNFDRQSHHQLQSFIQISGASLPPGPTLTAASSTDPQYLSQV